LISDYSSESVEKQVRLQMTWGRIFVFWKYWIECRKDSTELLQKLLDVIVSCEEYNGDDTVSPVLHTQTS